ncbi:hypothetical protein [Aquamicrobium sp. LC103]|uniref:hypothetical protein n=1 Tax=Aquamicrobium sp. LC103 TaxID=1120658 RepID=UPI00063EB80F|nr:hypothetical protein [Aquamicrobium sp. LC103]TKT69141.1 hypothetical protein XW59_028890 [Aquamicrobium sp. LC103]
MSKDDAQPLDAGLALDLIERIQADLERLKALVEPRAGAFDPADPRNKTCDGKLTPEGVETCYRLFDEGQTRYSVARAMKISFAAATHRFNAWRKAGGSKRRNMRLG